MDKKWDGKGLSHLHRILWPEEELPSEINRDLEVRIHREVSARLRNQDTRMRDMFTVKFINLLHEKDMEFDPLLIWSGCKPLLQGSPKERDTAFKIMEALLGKQMGSASTGYGIAWRNRLLNYEFFSEVLKEKEIFRRSIFRQFLGIGENVGANSGAIFELVTDEWIPRSIESNSGDLGDFLDFLREVLEDKSSKISYQILSKFIRFCDRNINQISEDERSMATLIAIMRSVIRGKRIPPLAMEQVVHIVLFSSYTDVETWRETVDSTIQSNKDVAPTQREKMFALIDLMHSERPFGTSVVLSEICGLIMRAGYDRRKSSGLIHSAENAELVRLSYPELAKLFYFLAQAFSWNIFEIKEDAQGPTAVANLLIAVNSFWMNRTSASTMAIYYGEHPDTTVLLFKSTLKILDILVSRATKSMCPEWDLVFKIMDRLLSVVPTTPDECLVSYEEYTQAVVRYFEADASVYKIAIEKSSVSYSFKLSMGAPAQFIEFLERKHLAGKRRPWYLYRLIQVATPKGAAVRELVPIDGEERRERYAEGFSDILNIVTNVVRMISKMIEKNTYNGREEAYVHFVRRFLFHTKLPLFEKNEELAGSYAKSAHMFLYNLDEVKRYTEELSSLIVRPSSENATGFFWSSNLRLQAMKYLSTEICNLIPENIQTEILEGVYPALCIGATDSDDLLSAATLEAIGNIIEFVPDASFPILSEIIFATSKLKSGDVLFSSSVLFGDNDTGKRPAERAVEMLCQYMERYLLKDLNQCFALVCVHLLIACCKNPVDQLRKRAIKGLLELRLNENGKALGHKGKRVPLKGQYLELSALEKEFSEIVMDLLANEVSAEVYSLFLEKLTELIDSLNIARWLDIQRIAIVLTNRLICKEKLKAERAEDYEKCVKGAITLLSTVYHVLGEKEFGISVEYAVPRVMASDMLSRNPTRSLFGDNSPQPIKDEVEKPLANQKSGSNRSEILVSFCKIVVTTCSRIEASLVRKPGEEKQAETPSMGTLTIKSAKLAMDLVALAICDGSGKEVINEFETLTNTLKMVVMLFSRVSDGIANQLISLNGKRKDSPPLHPNSQPTSPHLSKDIRTRRKSSDPGRQWDMLEDSKIIPHLNVNTVREGHALYIWDDTIDILSSSGEFTLSDLGSLMNSTVSVLASIIWNRTLVQRMDASHLTSIMETLSHLCAFPIFFSPDPKPNREGGVSLIPFVLTHQLFLQVFSEYMKKVETQNEMDEYVGRILKLMKSLRIGIQCMCENSRDAIRKLHPDVEMARDLLVLFFETFGYYMNNFRTLRQIGQNGREKTVREYEVMKNHIRRRNRELKSVFYLQSNEIVELQQLREGRYQVTRRLPSRNIRFVANLLNVNKLNPKDINSAIKELYASDVGERIQPATDVDADRLYRFIDNLDDFHCAFTHKISVVYYPPESAMEKDKSMMYNILGSRGFSTLYTEFIESLGKKVWLKGARGYTAGLDTEDDRDGSYTVIWEDTVSTTVFYIASLMPNWEGSAHPVEKKNRLVGNTTVMIVFNDNDKDFNLKKIENKVNLIFIVITPVSGSSDPTGGGRKFLNVEIQVEESFHDIIPFPHKIRFVSSISSLPSLVRMIAFTSENALESYRFKQRGRISSFYMRLSLIRSIRQNFSRRLPRFIDAQADVIPSLEDLSLELT